MLRPGYSLVGMTGTVFAVGGFVPAGHVQVVVDGEVVDDDGGARVLIVNVPSAHLELLAPPQPEAAAPEATPAAPAFTMVAKQKPKKVAADADKQPAAAGEEAKPAPPEQSPDEPENGEPEKPFGLRLV